MNEPKEIDVTACLILQDALWEAGYKTREAFEDLCRRVGATDLQHLTVEQAKELWRIVRQKD